MNKDVIPSSGALMASSVASGSNMRMITVVPPIQIAGVPETFRPPMWNNGMLESDTLLRVFSPGPLPPDALKYIMPCVIMTPLGVPCVSSL